MAERYLWRKSVFEKSLREVVLTDRAIGESRPGVEVAIPFDDIRLVRVTFAPTRYKFNRHTVTIDGRGGRRIEFENTHFAGVGNFADQSAEFTAFADAFLSRLSLARPGLRVQLGARPFSYFMQLVTLIVVYGFLAFLIASLPNVAGSVTSLIKGGIILVMLPLMLRWSWRSRPRSIPVGETPRGYLPE